MTEKPVALPSSPAPTKLDLKKERQAFEGDTLRLIKNGMYGWNLERDGDGYYQGVVHARWKGWLARAEFVESVSSEKAEEVSKVEREEL